MVSRQTSWSSASEMFLSLGYPRLLIDVSVGLGHHPMPCCFLTLTSCGLSAYFYSFLGSECLGGGNRRY